MPLRNVQRTKVLTKRYKKVILDRYQQRSNVLEWKYARVQ